MKRRAGFIRHIESSPPIYLWAVRNQPRSPVGTIRMNSTDRFIYLSVLSVLIY